MNNIIIAIGGNPGSGKTSLVKSIMFEKLASDNWSHNIKDKDFNLVSYSHNPDKNLFVLGKYDNNPTNIFCGTDLLSMAVQPSAKKWITSLASPSIIIFEGDRLFNHSFLSFLHNEYNNNLNIFYLNVPQDILNHRYSLRGSHQNPSFLKGRITKYNNIIQNKSPHPYHHLIQILENNSLEQQQEVVEKILRLIF
jgi:tRNA uridine 5-carbamoylmethylation protein Kti12